MKIMVAGHAVAARSALGEIAGVRSAVNRTAYASYTGAQRAVHSVRANLAAVAEPTHAVVRATWRKGVVHEG